MSTTTRPARRRLAGRGAVLAVALPAGAVLALLVMLALFAPLVAPYDALHQDLVSALQGPSAAHWLGTDDLGRDVLSRLIVGCRIAATAATEATSIAVILGVPLGLVIGYRGGWLDWMVIPGLADDDSSVVSEPWYRAPGWRAAARQTKTHTKGRDQRALV